MRFVNTTRTALVSAAHYETLFASWTTPAQACATTCQGCINTIPEQVMSLYKIATMVKGLPRYDGKDKHAYLDWKARVKVHLNMSAPAIYDTRMGQEKPNPTLGDNLAKWQRNIANIYSVLFLATNGGATTVVRRHEGKKPEGGLGDGDEA